jgi:hypothetical protein
MTDKLAGMQMFVRVVEAGSFAAAAEISNVTATMAANTSAILSSGWAPNCFIGQRANTN